MPDAFGLVATPLPEHGRPADDILAELQARKADDRDWRGGKVFSLVYSAGEEHLDLLERAGALYSAENGLNVLAFPSIGLLQHDLVRITATLLGGREGDEIDGFVTSGGTESLLQAVLVARDHARAERGIAHPQVVAATSAHAAFDKAAHYFDVDVVRVPVGADYRADLAAMARAVTDRTAMLVVSAPTYPHGVVDPIAEAAALAAERGLLCHVDACMGGFLLPFLARAGRFDTPFDFAVDGVTSMSADLHKYGYAAKGASVVLYRTSALKRRQVFLTTNWLGGLYASTGVAGTRPAGPIAAAWASLMHLGLDGLERVALTAHDAARRLRAGVEAIDGLAVRGDPPATVLAFGAAETATVLAFGAAETATVLAFGAAEPGALETGAATAVSAETVSRGPGAVDIFAVGDRLAADGWYLDRQTPPDSLHATVHAGHAGTVDALVEALAAAVAETAGRRSADRTTTYGAPT